MHALTILHRCVAPLLAGIHRRRLAVLPDFGRHLGYDGKAIESHSSGQVNRAKGETSDPNADWGKHETGGVDARTGKPWTKIKSWFGYGLHLIADTHYEIRPLIDTRELWREEKSQPDYDPSKPITRPLFPERADTIVHTEKGSVHCICPHTREQRDLAHQARRARPAYLRTPPTAARASSAATTAAAHWSPRFGS